MGYAFNVQAHGTYHDLIALLDRELALHPQDATLHLRYAELHVEHQDWQAAMISLERARRQGLAADETQFLEGRALALAGHWQAAKTALDKYLTLHPDRLLALVERARVQRQLGKLELAIADYRQALSSSERQQPELHVEVAEALVQGAHQEEALQVLTAGMAEFGAVPQLVLKALELELAAKQYDRAMQRIDTMQRQMPRPEPWMLKRASVLAQAGRLDEARQAFAHLVQHLNALPNLERGSHAMCQLMEQARTALTALGSMTSIPSLSSSTTAQNQP